MFAVPRTEAGWIMGWMTGWPPATPVFKITTTTQNTTVTTTVSPLAITLSCWNRRAGRPFYGRRCLHCPKGAADVDVYTPPSKANSMAVVPSASLLHKSGILFLSLSVTTFLSLPSKPALKLPSSNSILTSSRLFQCLSRPCVHIIPTHTHTHPLSLSLSLYIYIYISVSSHPDGGKRQGENRKRGA